MRRKMLVKAVVITAAAVLLLLAGLLLLRNEENREYAEHRDSMTEGFGQLKTVSWNGIRKRPAPAPTAGAGRRTSCCCWQSIIRTKRSTSCRLTVTR